MIIRRRVFPPEHNQVMDDNVGHPEKLIEILAFLAYFEIMAKCLCLNNEKIDMITKLT